MFCKFKVQKKNVFPQYSSKGTPWTGQTWLLESEHSRQKVCNTLVMLCPPLFSASPPPHLLPSECSRHHQRDSWSLNVNTVHNRTAKSPRIAAPQKLPVYGKHQTWLLCHEWTLTHSREKICNILVMLKKKYRPCLLRFICSRSILKNKTKKSFAVCFKK